MIILFHTLNFVISPINHGNLKVWDANVVFQEFIYYISFILLILVIDYYWRKNKENTNNIINITRFLQQYKCIKFSKIGYTILIFCLLFSLIYYLPRATYILHIEEEMGGEIDYQAKSPVIFWGNVWNIIGLLLSMNFIISHKLRKYNILDSCLFISYLILLIFFPRRVFLFGILFLILTLYSINRKAINKKLIMLICGGGLLFYLIYFPFYNVMRNSSFIFDSENPIESLNEIVSNAIDNWSYRDQDMKSEGASGMRSLNLYSALYNLIRWNPDPKYGELTFEAVDVAIPKVINPNKGDGPEHILEAMTRQYSDQADSFLLHSYGEFHYWGFIYASCLFYIIFVIYNAYGRLWRKITRTHIINLYISHIMVSCVWNVEAGVNGNFSWFFSSFAMLLFLVILEKSKIIVIETRNINSVPLK